MSLFPSLRTNLSSLLTITPSIAFLFIILQLAIWYPILSEEHTNLDNQIKRQERVVATWKAIIRQSNLIEKDGFLQSPWLTQKTSEKVHGVHTRWQIEGRTSINEWQTLFEKIQTQLALGVVSVHWEKETNGRWYGRLLFDIKAPKANRAFRHWLPVKLHSGRFVEKDWRVLSTMRVGNKTSALLEYKRTRHWVEQGNWLPNAGLTVERVSFDQVTLEAKDGSQVALTVREVGEKRD